MSLSDRLGLLGSSSTINDNSGTIEEIKNLYSSLIDKESYIGDSINTYFQEMDVLINNAYKNKVGGITENTLLLATRMTEDNLESMGMHTSIILLRVRNYLLLPNSKEIDEIRIDQAQSVAGETEKHWDGTGAMDTTTKLQLDSQLFKCKILGTFYIDEENCKIKWGGDHDTIEINRGYKIYKPQDKKIEFICNYLSEEDKISEKQVFGYNPPMTKVGYYRLTSTHRNTSKPSISLKVTDLLSSKTAVYGTTRSGKSNLMKILGKAIHELRLITPEARIGQLYFDPNGEYANVNIQDDNTALRNIYQQIPGAQKFDEVVTYGLVPHENDKERTMMLINFFDDKNLQLGKSIINESFSTKEADYIKNFKMVSFEKNFDENIDYSSKVRYDRKVLAYRTLLFNAGFLPSSDMKPSAKKLFGTLMLDALKASEHLECREAGTILEQPSTTWNALSVAFSGLNKFLTDKNGEYDKFESNYIKKSDSGEKWADEDLKKIIYMWTHPNGIKLMGQCKERHSNTAIDDYAVKIYKDLTEGKLVIIDQSVGHPLEHGVTAERIMNTIFQEQTKLFTGGEKRIPEILIYIEEAHNLLPAGNEIDYSNIWVRVAKEGAKFHIGMVYSTQEVSSINKSIMRQTENFFITKLNNKDETRELNKYFDFVDFESAILSDRKKGLVSFRTKSKPFTVTMQCDKFII